ncbi:MAG TPA: YceI family protein [Bacteriovoracaceae bacterium]|nr:YceI family protein [Bacteriovoracaceae bacterium]
MNAKYILMVFFLYCFNLNAEVWQINKDHSEVFFEVPYLNVSSVTGRFTKFSGTTQFDEAGVPRLINIEIDASSIETGNRLRDGHLKSSEFLKSKEFPHITYKSDAVAVRKGGSFETTGELTIAGVSKKQVFEFSVTPITRDTWSYQSRFIKFKTTVGRKNFNLLWNKTLEGTKYLVGDEIMIRGTFQVQPQNLGTPSSKHMIPDTAYIRNREKLLRGEAVPEKAVVVSSSTPESTVKAAPAPLTIAPPPQSNVLYSRDFRQSFIWQVSFTVLGLLGFVSSIIIGLFTKKWVLHRYPEKYREGGQLGIITDSITIIFVMLYVMALWEVGWG